MGWYLTREYGNTVKVNYNDLSKPSVREGFPEVIEQLRKGDLVLPAVFVNDEVVTLGYVDYLSIAKALEKARSNGNAKS